MEVSGKIAGVVIEQCAEDDEQSAKEKKGNS